MLKTWLVYKETMIIFVVVASQATAHLLRIEIETYYIILEIFIHILFIKCLVTLKFDEISQLKEFQAADDHIYLKEDAMFPVVWYWQSNPIFVIWMIVSCAYTSQIWMRVVPKMILEWHDMYVCYSTKFRYLYSIKNNK